MIRITSTAVALLMLGTSLSSAQSEVDGYITDFLAADGFEQADVDALNKIIDDNLLPSDLVTPGGSLGPLVKAAIIADNSIPGKRTRTEISYGQFSDVDEAGSAAQVSFIEVGHYNLGPALRAELVGDLGEENVADVAEFGEGESRIWRFVFRPTMNDSATLLDASSRTVSEDELANLKCGPVACNQSYRDMEELADWTEVEADEEEQIGNWFPEYVQRNDELATLPHAVAILANMGYWTMIDGDMFIWDYNEQPEGARGSEPFRFISIDRDLGNESVIDAVWHETKLNDDAITDLWYRYVNMDVMEHRFEATEGR